MHHCLSKCISVESQKDATPRAVFEPLVWYRLPHLPCLPHLAKIILPRHNIRHIASPRAFGVPLVLSCAILGFSSLPNRSSGLRDPEQIHQSKCLISTTSVRSPTASSRGSRLYQNLDMLPGFCTRDQLRSSCDLACGQSLSSPC